MQKSFLANTGIAVSRIGLGTVKFGRNEGLKYPATFALPNDKEIADLLALSADLGINLLDTAPAYGKSEERIGKCLAKKRQDWVISTKVGEEFINGVSQFDFSPRALEQSITRSLKRLQTDYLDVVLVHSDGHDEAIIQDEQVFTTLEQFKKMGMIRAYGMSTKTVRGGLLTVDQSDLAMVTYNPTYTDEGEVIRYAQQKQKGIFIKKAFVSGHLHLLKAEDPIAYSLQSIFALAGVTSVIVGTLNPQHLTQIASCA